MESRPFTADALAHVCDEPQDVVEAALDEAAAYQLLEMTEGGGWRFHHGCCELPSARAHPQRAVAQPASDGRLAGPSGDPFQLVDSADHWETLGPTGQRWRHG